MRDLVLQIEVPINEIVIKRQEFAMINAPNKIEWMAFANYWVPGKSPGEKRQYDSSSGKDPKEALDTLMMKMGYLRD